MDRKDSRVSSVKSETRSENRLAGSRAGSKVTLDNSKMSQHIILMEKEEFASPQTLSREMSKVVNRKLFSDVHFFVGPTREKIFGHKCVLAARCKVFKQLFLSDPTKNSFDICSVKPLSFLLLLYFLYTNSISFDKLDIYEAYDVMRTASDYKCKELSEIVEGQFSSMYDHKNVFEFFMAALELKTEIMRQSALEYIEDNSSTLLVAGNTDILGLNPHSMKAILLSDELELEELKVVDVACYWAENYLRGPRDVCNGEPRRQIRLSIKPVEQQEDGTPDSSISSGQYKPTEAERLTGGYDIMTRRDNEVADVMCALRLPLIPLNDLARLEEEQASRRLIPQQYFVTAWRIHALQLAQSPIPDKPELKMLLKPRNGTIIKPTRRKSYGDALTQARRLKTGMRTE